ncbi:MAG: hypothetical protein E7480_07360 [Ruminococcaceae bacterium]|nr:hypothetical protein [Oscillospiraceae bacterium]
MITRPEEDMKSPYYEINNHRRKYQETAVSFLEIYSLKPDLYGMRCYKGETHCHTFESDGLVDAIHTVGNYRSSGYDFLAITDHFTSYASEKAMRVFKDAPVNMTLIFGEEVHVPTERIHSVHMGGRESVNEYFRNHTEEAKAEVAAIQATLSLPADVDPEDYAWRIWVSRKAHEFGGISVLSHPFWIWQQVYFMTPACTKQLLRDGVHDALDLRDDDMQAAVAFWQEMREEGINIPIVGSSDSHLSSPENPYKSVGGGYMFVFAPDNSTESILNAILKGNSVCVNNYYQPEFTFGSFRLVKFSKFLLDNFYPNYMRLCHNQGVLMSEYPLNDKPSEELISLLSKLNKRSEAFAREFYGY